MTNQSLTYEHEIDFAGTIGPPRWVVEQTRLELPDVVADKVGLRAVWAAGILGDNVVRLVIQAHDRVGAERVAAAVRALWPDAVVGSRPVGHA